MLPLAMLIDMPRAPVQHTHKEQQQTKATPAAQMAEPPAMRHDPSGMCSNAAGATRRCTRPAACRAASCDAIAASARNASPIGGRAAAQKSRAAIPRRVAMNGGSVHAVDGGLGTSDVDVLLDARSVALDGGRGCVTAHSMDARFASSGGKIAAMAGTA